MIHIKNDVNFTQIYNKIAVKRLPNIHKFLRTDGNFHVSVNEAFTRGSVGLCLHRYTIHSMDEGVKISHIGPIHHF